MIRAGIVVCSLSIVVLIAAFAYTWKDCSDRKGVLVRGVFWYECLKEDARRP